MNWLDWLLTAARFASLSGAILLAAIFGFRLLMIGSDRRMVRTELFAVKWVLVFELAAFLGQAAWLGGLYWSLDPDIGSDGFDECQAFFVGTQVGKIGLLRCGLLLLLMAYTVLRFNQRTRSGSKIVSSIEAMLVFCQLGLLSWLSHAAAVVGPSGWVQLGNDLLHLTGAAIWPGGLIPLWLWLRQPVPETVKLNALVRFSNVSVVVAPLIGATGILSGYFRLHAFAPLITTPYGRYVFLKAACFFVLIGVGTVNRLKLIPGLHAAAPSGTQPLARDWRRLHRNIVIEQIFLLLVLLAVARLSGLPPPHPE